MWREEGEWPSQGCVSRRPEPKPVFSAALLPGQPMGTSSKVSGLWCCENMRWWLRAPARTENGPWCGPETLTEPVGGCQGRPWVLRDDLDFARKRRRRVEGGRAFQVDGPAYGMEQSHWKDKWYPGMGRRLVSIMKLASVGSLQRLGGHASKGLPGLPYRVWPRCPAVGNIAVS